MGVGAVLAHQRPASVYNSQDAHFNRLRQQQEKVLNKLSDGPIILTQHGRASVVLVSPEHWNQLVEELEDLQDALDAVEARQDLEPSALGCFASTRRRKRASSITIRW
jgi:prevent-host-death family protein